MYISPKVLEDTIVHIKDFFYKKGKSSSAVFNENCNSERLVDEAAFNKIIKTYCGSLHPKLVEAVYHKLKPKNDLGIDSETFTREFHWEVPPKEWRTAGLKKIRDWIYKMGLSSEQAFERFMNYRANKLGEGLTREDLQRACTAERIPLTMLEVDFIYRVMDENGDGVIVLPEWLEIIYEDASNPL